MSDVGIYPVIREAVIGPLRRREGGKLPLLIKLELSAPGNNDVIYQEAHDFFICGTIIGSADTSLNLVLLIERIIFFCFFSCD